MYPAELGTGQTIDLDPSSSSQPEISYSHKQVAGHVGQKNLYAYVENNPLMFVDPSGLEQQMPTYGNYIFPTLTPAFPMAGKVNKSTSDSLCLCARKKKNQIKKLFKPTVGLVYILNNPVTGHNSTPNNAPVGEHKFFKSATPGSGVLIGVGGCAPCVGLVIKCPNGVAVFHFHPNGDLPSLTVTQYKWPEGCHAIICGGTEEKKSRCLAESAIRGVKSAGITLDFVAGETNCGVKPNGYWYISQFGPRE